MANTPETRAAAERAIRAYLPGRSNVADSFENDPETPIIDLIADLLHLAVERGIDAQPALDRAVEHFTYEQNGGV